MSETIVGSGRLREDEVLVHQPLLSQVEGLGKGPSQLREGGIRFGHPTVSLLRQAENRTFVLVGFPFDLDPPGTGRVYPSAAVRISVTTADARVRSLWPALVRNAADAERARVFGVTDDMEFAPTAGGTHAFHYVDLLPVIRSFGSGMPTFSWRFDQYEDHGLVPAGRRVFALLDVPVDTRALIGSVTATVEVRRKILGVLRTITAATDITPLSIRLPLPAEPTASAPTVFLSYAHDSPEHVEQVLWLARLLTANGIDVTFDLWSMRERRDWMAWANEHLPAVDHVIVVASPKYRAVGDGNGPPDADRDVQTEATTLRELLHGDRRKWLPKILPVLLPGHDQAEIPLFLQPFSASHYQVTEFTTAGAIPLLRVLTGQPEHVPPPLGRIPRF